MSDEDDYVGEFGFSNGSRPIGIRAFPGAHWNRRTKLHSNISSLSRTGGEALIPVTRQLGQLGSISRQKRDRENQQVPLPIDGEI